MEAQFSDDSFNILMVHGGEEWSEGPSESLRAFYRSLIDMGVDMVIGSHPHVLHGFESHNGGLIAYSLGNFIFPGMDETKYGEESLILGVGVVDQTVRYVELFPVRINNRTVAMDTGGEILERVLAQTEELHRER